VPRLLSFLVFLAIALSILAAMHGYIWVRLVRDPGVAEPWRRIAGIALVLLVLSFPAAMFLRRTESALGQIFPTIAFGWLGVAFLLLIVLLAIDGVRLLVISWELVAGWLRARTAEAPADPARRILVAQAVAGAALAVTGATTVFAVRRAGGPARIDEVPVPIARLPRALSGLTIAQITDLHVGPTIREKEVRRVVEQTNGLRPDVIAVTGDLMDGGVRDLGPIVAGMAGLRARLGVFFVTGNHEYYSGFEEWDPFLRSLGMRVLHNERTAIGDAGPGGATIDLAGVDDYGHSMDLRRALDGRDGDRALVLLAHQPRGIEAAVRSGVDLQLSGHTHGGQIVPFNFVVGLTQPYVRGLHKLDEPSAGRSGHIYVSRGTGYWGPPMRLGSPPEIAKIVLVPA